MSNKFKCPVCNVPLTACGDLLSCPNDHCGWVGNAALWQALIQSQQQLKILEPIVASLQGRADINAEEARDSNELVVQWYEKYEQSQKDLKIARKVLEKLICEYKHCRDEEFEGADIDWEWWAMAARNVVETALKQIEHKE